MPACSSRWRIPALPEWLPMTNRRFALPICRGIEGFVGVRVLDHGVAVNAGLMGEGHFAHDGPVAGDGTPRGGGHHLAQGQEAMGIRVACQVGVRIHGHDDLLQCRIAGPFAETVHRDTERVRPGFGGRQGVGRGHAEIVVAVKFKRQFRDGCAQVTDEPDHRRRAADAHRVGNTQSMCPQACGGVGERGEPGDVGTGGVPGHRW